MASTPSLSAESKVVIDLYDTDYADSNQRHLFLSLQSNGDSESTDSESDNWGIIFNGQQFIVD